MKIETLRSFQAVLATGSFAGAAKQLNLTPSAVSLQMKQLEEYFGQLLFDRSARTALPTPFALASAAPLAQSLALLDGLRVPRALSAAGILRLGVIASIEKSVLPRTLRLLQAEHPALAVRMSLDVSGALVDSVKAGRIDAAVAVRPQSGGSTRMHWYDLMRESFVLLAPPVAPGGRSDGTPAQLLERLPWIRYDTRLTGGRIAAAYVRRICASPKPGFEITSTDAIMAMAPRVLGCRWCRARAPRCWRRTPCDWSNSARTRRRARSPWSRAAATPRTGACWRWPTRSGAQQRRHRPLLPD